MSGFSTVIMNRVRSRWQADLFTDTCTVQRSAITQNTAGETVDDWHVIAPSVACMFTVKEQRLISPESGEYILTIYHLRVSAGTDVQKSDRITNILRSDGTTENGPFHIRSAVPVRANTVVFLALDLEYIPGSPA